MADRCVAVRSAVLQLFGLQTGSLMAGPAQQAVSVNKRIEMYGRQIWQAWCKTHCIGQDFSIGGEQGT